MEETSSAVCTVPSVAGTSKQGTREGHQDPHSSKATVHNLHLPAGFIVPRVQNLFLVFK